MRFTVFVGVVTAASCLANGPAVAADDEIILEPSSAWAMNYDDDSCALQRLFGEPGNQVMLEFRRFSPASRMQISVTSDSIRRGLFSRLKYSFGPNGEWHAASTIFPLIRGEDHEGFVFSGSILPELSAKERRERLVDTVDEALVTEAFGKVSNFQVSGGFRRPVTLKTGRLVSAHKAMEKCLDELLTHWGIDAEAHKTLTRNARPVDLDRLARNISYPPGMLAAGESGLVRFRLAIDATGVVTACHIQLSISNTAFEKSACGYLEKAKFEPALDKDGRPIATYFVEAVAYEMS